MDPDDLALLNQWLAARNPNGAYQPLTGGGPWANPIGQAGPSQTGVGAAPDGQGAAGPAPPPLVWPDFQDGSAAATSPQDYADALQSLIGRSGGGRDQSAEPPVSHNVGRGGDLAATADIIGGGPSRQASNSWADTYDQVQGRAPPPWRQLISPSVPTEPKTSAAPPLPGYVGPKGYRPAPGDEQLLARVIYAEGASMPDDFAALGWSALNRVGSPRFGKTLNDVVYQPQQFDSVQNGGSPLWRETADPSKLTGVKALRFQQARQIAGGILGGAISDPTAGAPYFFASDDLDGDAAKAAPPSFKKGLTDGDYLPSQYQGHIGVVDPHGHKRRNYFLKNAR